MNNSLLKKYAIYTKNHLFLYFIVSVITPLCLYAFDIIILGNIKSFREIIFSSLFYKSMLTCFISISVFDFSLSKIKSGMVVKKQESIPEAIASKSEEQFCNNCIHISKNTAWDMIEIGIKDDAGIIVEQMAFTTEQAKFVAESIQIFVLQREKNLKKFGKGDLIFCSVGLLMFFLLITAIYKASDPIPSTIFSGALMYNPVLYGGVGLALIIYYLITKDK